MLRRGAARTGGRSEDVCGGQSGRAQDREFGGWHMGFDWRWKRWALKETELWLRLGGGVEDARETGDGLEFCAQW